MTEGPLLTERRPVVAVAHGERSLSAMKVAEAAASVCDLVWIVDSTEFVEPQMVRLLRKLGTTVDTAGMSDDDAADALRLCRPDGIVAYAEHMIPTASALASRLGLDYHDADVTGRLVDKFTQRQALRDGGLPVPRFFVLPPSPTRDDVEVVATGVDFPVVVKPRRGFASRDTMLVNDAQQLQELLVGNSTLISTQGEPMIVEEYLAGASPPLSPHFADYVSVESVVSGGQTSHVAVTGRFPPDEPFRESGLFIPSDLTPSQVEDVLDVATRAISALGIRIGFLHTEIKLTPRGPQVIEVNGRLGGSVPEMTSIAAGIDLIELSLRVALGEKIGFETLAPTDRVGYLFSPHSPQWARRIVSIEGLDRLSEYPGVQFVFLNRKPGDEIDWRKGSHEYVFLVIGGAPDHQGLLAARRFVYEQVRVTYA
jgi:hypothetical protein